MLIIQRPEIEADEPEGNTQRFTISPLEPGFGHTLGNSLRRTLLSSIPGAAVTQVRFDDALHEFDVIPGVKEDVTDLILNLKDLVLHLLGRGAGHAAPRRARPGRGHRRRHPDHLRRRDPQPRAAPRDGQREGPPRPRPHRRAGPRLRVGRADKRPSTDRRDPGRRDLLAGAAGRVRRSSRPASSRPPTTTSSPSRSRPTVRSRRATRSSSAGDTLRNLVALVADLSRRAARASSSARSSPVDATSPDLELPIEELDLSERPRNCLKRARVDTIGQLVQKTEDDLLAITNFGPKSLDEVLQKLDERGLVAAHEGVTDARPEEGSALRRVTPPTSASCWRTSPRACSRPRASPPRCRRRRRCGPYAEKLITKAKKGGVHRQRQVVATIHDQDVTHKLFAEIGPRYADRNGGYLRILKLGSAPGRQRADGAHRTGLTPASRVRSLRTGIPDPQTLAQLPLASPPRVLRLAVAYDGTDFRGFAAQPDRARSRACCATRSSGCCATTCRCRARAAPTPACTRGVRWCRPSTATPASTPTASPHAVNGMLGPGDRRAQRRRSSTATSTPATRPAGARYRYTIVNRPDARSVPRPLRVVGARAARPQAAAARRRPVRR